MGITGARPSYAQHNHCRRCSTSSRFILAPITSKMKGLKKFRKRLSLVSRSISNSNGTGNLLPLKFHSVHGTNITLHRNRTVAKRQESFCKGLTFTDRPVKIDEKIFIKLIDKSDSWSGAIRFGYTSHDPVTLKNKLPKYACPDLTHERGFWAKAVNERYADKDVVLYFYVTRSGSVHFGINGHSKEILFTGVDTSCPLWAMIDVYGNSTAIELVNGQLNNSLVEDQEAGFNLNSIRRVLDVTDYEERSALRTNSSSHCDSTTANIHCGNDKRNCHRFSNCNDVTNRSGNEIYPATVSRPVQHLTKFDSVVKTEDKYLKLKPLLFHEKHGRNIRLSNDKFVASRNDSEYAFGYVFSSTPIRENEFLVVQILKTDKRFLGGLTFGVTAKNPAKIDTHSLPEDADDLINDKDYFVVYKNVANSPSEGDELVFSIVRNGTVGDVMMKKNNEQQMQLFCVDITVPLWWFFDIYGSTVKIQAYTSGGLLSENHVHNSHSNHCSPIVSNPSKIEHNKPLTMNVMNEPSIINTGNVSTTIVNRSGVPTILVVKCYSTLGTCHGMEPINIIVQNQSGTSSIITQNQQLTPSQMSNTRYQSGACINNFGNSHTFRQVDHSATDNGKNREYQLQEWAKSKTRSTPSNNRLNECTVCYERPVDAVLYTCGHMCMCYNCARELWRGKGDGHCPMCRAFIRDVIRTYRS